MKKLVTFIVTAVFVITFALSVGMGAYAFSDEYEPYYPHITAVTRSVDEIYQRITGPELEYKPEVEKSIREMIQMYKDVGIDVSLDMENWLCSYRMVSDFPQRWSTKTPIPLGESPDYSGAFSIDAPWNNKIPEDAPRTYIPPTGLRPFMNLAVVKANVDGGGWGTGIPQIVSTSADPYITIAAKYNYGNVNKIFMFHAKKDFRDYINNNQNGDEHIQFIDAETNTAVQTWSSRAQGDPRGYKLSGGALADYTVRGHAAGIEYRLDGIGAEGQCGVNAANPPTNAFTIKSSEIKSTTEMINHAIGGAIGQMIGGRVFPTVSTDAGTVVKDGKGSNRVYNIGVVPYGGIVQLDPELDLDALYEAKKISFHTYRILRCMQEYGFYNIDCSGGGGTGGILLYTSTYSNDYINPDFEGFNVPYKEGKQGFDPVCKELQAFLSEDWEWFGLTEQPKLFLTVPVVKYADLDVNDDGVIDITDHDLVVQHSGEEYTDANKQYDVNQDKEISPADIEIMYNYLNDLPMHTFTWHDVSFKDNDDAHGRIVVSGTSKTENGVTQYRDGLIVSFGTEAKPGYEFAGWTGDFEKYGKQPVVKVTMDRSYTIGAKYKKKAERKITFKVNGPGHIEQSDNGMSFEAPRETYGVRDLIMIKAVPDEGYEFLGWAGDISGFTNPVNILVEEDMEIIALFGKPGYIEAFKPDNWEFVVGDKEAYSVNEGENIKFNSKAFDYENMLVANKNKDKLINLEKDYSIRVKMNKSGNTGDLLQGKFMFNYKDDKNHYYIAIGGSGFFEFGKTFKGTKTVLKSIEGLNSTVVNGVVFSPTIDFEIIRKGSYIYVNGYKDGEKYEYCKVRDKSLKGGSIAVGSRHNGGFYASDIIISDSVVDAKDAKVQVWAPNGDTGPWVPKLRDAVVIAVDSEKAYVKGDYTTVSKGVNPFFADDGKMIYVPVRYVTEKLGGKITYDPATDSVVASFGDKSGSFKAWENGAKEVDGTLYVTALDLANALGKEYVIYKRVVFFSDTPEVYSDVTEPECQEFIKKAFDIHYYMGN